MKHEVKILPEWYEALISGLKPFEIRKDDRDPKYQPNDVLLLREFDGVKYTGRTITAKIKMVLRNEYCKEGYCIMSVEVISSYPQRKQTQADRIRNMSNEEIAEFLYKYIPTKKLPQEVDEIWCNNQISVYGAFKQWLESEVDNMDKKLTDKLSNNSPILANSLSDSEIKKAFEEHYNRQDSGYTDYLGFGGKRDESQENYLYCLRNTLDLINRLEAENERLQDDAYKEFAERLEDRIADRLDQSLDNPDGNNYFITDIFTDIKNLLKELVGE